ncbi:MAG: hypothetical protein ABIY50_10665 [Ignavibacteria bacterium]
MKESLYREKALSKRIQRLEHFLAKAYNNDTREKMVAEIEKLKKELDEERKNN